MHELEHIAKACDNLAFAESCAQLNARDWQITALYYSAVHYVDAFIRRTGGPAQIKSHTRRKQELMERVARTVFDEYGALEDLSREARYDQPNMSYIREDEIEAIINYITTELEPLSA